MENSGNKTELLAILSDKQRKRNWKTTNICSDSTFLKTPALLLTVHTHIHWLPIRARYSHWSSVCWWYENPLFTILHRLWKLWFNRYAECCLWLCSMASIAQENDFTNLHIDSTVLWTGGKQTTCKRRLNRLRPPRGPLQPQVALCHHQKSLSIIYNRLCCDTCLTLSK